MSIELTNLSNATSIGEMMTALNTLSGNWLGIGLLLSIWVISFITIQDTNRVKAATASFFTMIVAVLFLTVGIITNSTMWLVGFAFAVSLVFLYVPRV